VHSQFADSKRFLATAPFIGNYLNFGAQAVLDEGLARRQQLKFTCLIGRQFLAGSDLASEPHLT
jgi:hypothetical protein